MSRHTDMLGEISSSAKGAKRAVDLVAAMTPPGAMSSSSPSTAAMVKTTPQHVAHESWTSIIPGVATGAVGALAWKKHRVLGFLAGHALGSAAYPVYEGGIDRIRALCQFGVEGVGIGGALLYKKHPVVGWILGMLAGTAISTLVPESAARGYWNEWEQKRKQSK